MEGGHPNHRPTIAIDIPTPRISNQHAPPSYFDSPAASHATTAKDTATREHRRDGNTKKNKPASRSKSREKATKGSGPIHYQYSEQQVYEKQQRQNQHLHRPQHINSRQPSEEQRGENITPPRQQQSPGHSRTPSSGYYYGAISGSAFQSPSPSGHSTYQTPPRHPHSTSNATNSQAFTSKGVSAGTFAGGQSNGRTASPGSNGKKHQYHSDNEHDYYEKSNHHDRRQQHHSEEIRRISSGGVREEKKKNKLKPQQQQQLHNIHGRYPEGMPSPATIRTMDRVSEKHHRSKSASSGVAEMRSGYSNDASPSSHRYHRGYSDMGSYHDDHNNIGRGRVPIYSPPTPNHRKNRQSSSPERNPRHHLNQNESPSSFRQEEIQKHINRKERDLEDNASKKSRGLLSRASRKLKKRLVGADKSGGKSGATFATAAGKGSAKSPNGDRGDKTAVATMNAPNDEREPKTLQPHHQNGGRDPSPEKNYDEDEIIVRKRHQGQWAQGRHRDDRDGNDDGVRTRDRQKTVRSRHRYLHEEGSVGDEEHDYDVHDKGEESDDDDSTLSTNFSYELNDVIITTPSQPLDPKLNNGEVQQTDLQNHGHIDQDNRHFEDQLHQNQLHQHEMDHQQMRQQQLQRIFPPGSPPIMKKDPKYRSKDVGSNDHRGDNMPGQTIQPNAHQHNERQEQQFYKEDKHQEQNQQQQRQQSEYEKAMIEEIKALREVAAKAQREKVEIEKKFEEMSQKSEKEQQNILSKDMQSKKISWDNSDKPGENSPSGNSVVDNDGGLIKAGNVDDSNRSFAENQRRIHESLTSGKLLKPPVKKSSDESSRKSENDVAPNNVGRTNLHKSLMQEMKSKFGSVGSLKNGSKETSEKSTRWPSQRQPEDASSNGYDEERRKLQNENEMLKKEVQSMKIKFSRERDDESLSTKTSVSEMKATVLKLQKEFKKREDSHQAKIDEYEELLSLKEQELVKAMDDSIIAARELESLNEFSIQLTNDLEAYKKECASYRERILQKERDVSKMEQMLFDERKKVLSLESENEMLLNLADEKIVCAVDSEKSKQSEIDAYKEQCEKYRNRVIELERKIVTMESALDSTGKIASSLEWEKNSTSVKLDDLKKENNALESKLRESAESLESSESQVSSLKTKITSLENKFNQAKADVEARDTTITSLEIENGNLLQKLERQSKSLNSLQQSAEHCKQLEEEIADVKKENRELLSKQVQLKEELNSVQGTVSNVSRMQKILSENESFISSLQKDLSDTRNRNHQQFLEIRAKHSAEIDALTDKLSLEKKTRLEAETRNNELEEKMRNFEKDRSELEHQYTNHKRNLNEQLMKMMKDHDELRKQLVENEDKNSALQEEMSNVSRSNERLVNDLKDSVLLLERQKSEMSDSLAAIEVELLETRERMRKEIDALEKAVEERDKALASLRSDLAGSEKDKANKVEDLNGVIRGLEKKLDDTQSNLEHTSRSLEQAKASMRKQTNVMKRYMADFIHSIRMEKEGLMSDVQKGLLEEKAEISRRLKGIAQEYGWKMESKQMELVMNYQMTITTIRSDAFETNKDLKQRLAKEQNEVVSLQNSIEKLTRETDESKIILNEACERLNVTENGLIEKLEDMEVERAGHESEIATLRLDLATLESTVENLRDEKENLVLQKQNLSLSLKSKESDISRLELELARVSEDFRLKIEECVSLTDSLEQVRSEVLTVRNQMAQAEADARDQHDSSRSVIACLEKTMADKENEWEFRRTSLEAEVDSVRIELKKAVEGYKENLNEQQTTFESIILEKEEEAREMKFQQIESKKKISALEEQISILKDQSVDLHAQYSCISDTLVEVDYELRTKAIMSEQEYERVTAELNDCLGKLSFFQEDSKRLKSQLEEKMEATRNLHELMQRNAQTKADELAKHYMKIEDELRNQLFAVQSEKDALTRKLTVQHKETDKLMDEFFQEKRDLEASVETLEAECQTLCEELDRLSDEKASSARKAETLARTVDELNQKVRSLESCRETTQRFSIDLNDAKARIIELESEVCDANNEIDSLGEKLEKVLNDKAYALSVMQRRHVEEMDELKMNHDLQLSKVTSRLSELENEVERLQNTLQESRAQISLYEEEKISSCKKLDLTTKKLTRYEDDNYELQTSVTFFQTEIEELESKLSNLEKDNVEKDTQIANLKESLKHSLEEVLKLGESKRESLEKLAEITAAVSCIEEENEELKHTLMLSRSAAEREKSSISNDVVDGERHLSGCLPALEETELKRLEESKDTISEVESLRSKLTSLECQKREERGFEGKIAKLESKLKSVEDLKMENEEALMKRINQLEEGKEAGNFCNDLLQKLKASELKYEESLLALQTEIERLKNDLIFLNDENNELMRSKEDWLLQNNLLSEHVASLEDQLKSTTESMQAEINELEERLAFLSEEKAELEHTRDGIILQNDSLTETLSALEDQLESKSNDEKKNCQTLETKIHSMQAEIHCLKERVNSLASERQNLLHERNEILQQNDNLSKSLSSLEAELQTSAEEKCAHLKGYEAKLHSMQSEINVLNEELAALATEKAELLAARDDAILKNDSPSKSLSALELELQRNPKSNSPKSFGYDESSTSSSSSRESKLKLSRTIGELEATIHDIKKHHASKVRFLQAELNEARKRLKKSERKVLDLSNLLEENAIVIATLHKKLTSKKKPTRQEASSLPIPPTE